MFKLLRSRAKFFYWIIAVSFILFTFIVWGAQCNRQDNSRKQGPTWVGSVNGVKITTGEWDNTYRNYLARMRSAYQTSSLTTNQRAQASETVWQGLVRTKLEDEEIARLRLTVDDAEIIDVLKNNPPPDLLAQFTTAEGEVDLDAYHAELANPQRDWTGVEAYLRAMLPRQKLAESIAAGVTVSDQEIRDEYYRRNMKGIAEYVAVLFKDLTIDEQPTAEEIAAYYAEHESDFIEPEKVSVQLVTFLKDPSELDDSEVRELALEVRQEILDGTMDFEEAAAIYSEDGTKDEGGDLGTFDRERMVDEFSEAAFALPVGELSGPVKTQFGYHLIEVLERFEEDGEVARVHARHILLKITAGDETLTDIYERAQAFRKDALDIGFAEAAEDAALEVLHPRPLREGSDIPGFRNTIPGTMFAFSSSLGDIGRVMETEEFFYVIENLEYLPEGPAPLADVESAVIAKIGRARKSALAEQKLAPAVAALQAGGAFDGVAAEFGLTHAVTDTFTATGNIQDVGFNSDFNRAALDNEPGVLVEKVETNRGIFAMKVLWKSAFDEAAFAAEAASIHDSLFAARQNEAVEKWYQDKLATAKVDDRRYLLYAD
ncbi:peptidylprolyl isomerase [bacterium]|nr:peptidylprolyl isomerase [bacterium]MBU1074434.1 peptidylprolyl isomerase [bacterium]MBU1676859.1 peptidylprolyl isomerase [bacterium]